MRRLALLAAAMLAAAPALALRPYDQGVKAKASWMTVSSLKTGKQYYLEVSQDGQAMLREETQTSISTRRGSIKPQLAKDFFREIDNSDIINSQNVKKSKMVFYKGEVLQISAYVSGELTMTEAPMNNFGEAFSYAFGEVKKAVDQLPSDEKTRAFLRAVPLDKDETEAFDGKAQKDDDGGVKTIETYDLQKVKPLIAAIKEPYRLIPLDDEAALREVREFVAARQLSGQRTEFYVPSTRGTFKCEVLEAVRKTAAGAAKKQAPAAKRTRSRAR